MDGLHWGPVGSVARNREKPDIEDADDCKPDRRVSWSEETDTGLLAGNSAFMTVTVSVAETQRRSASEGGSTGGWIEGDFVRGLLDASKRLMIFWTRPTVSVDNILLCFLQRAS